MTWSRVISVLSFIGITREHDVMDSLEKQFREIVVKKTIQYAKDAVHRICISAAKAYMNEIDIARGFFDVTGNLYQSFAVGIYYDGSLLGIERVGGNDPLMNSLGEGQVFPFKVYYGGRAVSGRPYIGETGDGGQWGPEEAEYFLQDFKPANSKGFSLVVVAGMDYAEFVESKANHDVLTKLRDDAVSIFKRAI